MAAKRVLFVNTDNVFEITVTDSADDTAVDNMTATGTLMDGEGDTATAITGQTFPVSLTFIAAGLYRCTLEDGLAITDGVTYWFHVIATAPKDREWRIAFQAQYDNG